MRILPALLVFAGVAVGIIGMFLVVIHPDDTPRLKQSTQSSPNLQSDAIAGARSGPNAAIWNLGAVAIIAGGLSIGAGIAWIAFLRRKDFSSLDETQGEPVAPKNIANVRLTLDAGEQKDYRGIDRRVFSIVFPVVLALRYILTWVGQFLVDWYVVYDRDTFFAVLPWAAWGIVLVLLVCLTSYRLANLGMNRQWAYALLIPIVNIWLLLRCFACPTGYADHKTLDDVAKKCFAGFGVLFLVVLVMGYLFY